MAANKVSKNNARRFRFVTEKQSCGLIQECFGKSRISLDPSHYGFLEITSERHINYLLRFSALLAAALGALVAVTTFAAACGSRLSNQVL
jgi:hypothetical protein